MVAHTICTECCVFLKIAAMMAAFQRSLQDLSKIKKLFSLLYDIIFFNLRLLPVPSELDFSEVSIGKSSV
jgi:hypothetical protein